MHKKKNLHKGFPYLAPRIKKTTMKIKTLSVLAAAAFALTSCSSGNSTAEDSAAIAKGLTGALEKLTEAGSPKELITGDWKFADMTMPIPKDATKEQTDMMKSMLDEMKANNTMSFKADGTFLQNASMGGQKVTSKGTWKVSDDGKKLMTVTEGQDKTDEFEIAELSATTFRMKITDRGETLEMTWTK